MRTTEDERDGPEDEGPHENEWVGGRGVERCRETPDLFVNVEAVTLDDVFWKKSGVALVRRFRSTPKMTA